MAISSTIALGPQGSGRIDPNTTPGVQPLGLTGWSLTDSEEFDGGVVYVTDPTNGLVRFRPGGALWQTWYPNWAMFAADDPTSQNHTNSDYAAYYATSKVSMTPGSSALHLACDKQTTLNKPYTAGMITTIPAERNFLYGFFEVRARISGAGTGDWPAFWTTSAATNTWNSEIDMWESFDSSIYKTNIYTDGNGGSNGDGTWRESVTTMDQTGWHVYGCLWTSSGVTFYRDGSQTFTHVDHPTEPHYLLLNSGAKTSKSPTFNSSWVEFDYVRVWA
jgi:hypothetical protein